MKSSFCSIDELFGVSKIIKPNSNTASMLELNKHVFWNSIVKIRGNDGESESSIFKAENCNNIVISGHSIVAVFALNNRDLFISIKKRAMKCLLANLPFEIQKIKIWGLNFIIHDIDLYDGCCEFKCSLEDKFSAYYSQFDISDVSDELNVFKGSLPISVYFKLYEMQGNFYLVAYNSLGITFGRINKDGVAFEIGGYNMREITSDGIIKKYNRESKSIYIHELENTIGSG